MTISYLTRGKPAGERSDDDASVRLTVEGVLTDIEARSDTGVRTLSAIGRHFDGPRSVACKPGTAGPEGDLSLFEQVSMHPLQGSRRPIGA